MNLVVLRMCALLVCWSVVVDVEADDIRQIAVIKDNRIDESSGIAVSHIRRDRIWLHNDSGDQPRLYAVGLDGKTQATVDVRKAKAVDWEDMCSFEIDGQAWLLIADVGDNNRKRDEKRSKCRLYFVREPKLSDADDRGDDVRVAVNAAIEVSLTYEDGPQNCESVAVDTERREILLLSKSQPLDCRMYRVPLDLAAAEQNVIAEKIASIPIPLATAMDISPDGRQLAIVTMWTGLLVRREADETWEEAMNHLGRPLQLPQRKQGETVCFDQLGTSLYLNSERKDEPLWQLTLSDDRQ